MSSVLALGSRAAAVAGLRAPERRDDGHRLAAEALLEQRVGSQTQSPEAFVLDEPSTVECAEKFSIVTKGLPVLVARLEHAHVGVDDLVGLVVVELVGEQVAAAARSRSRARPAAMFR